MMTLHPISKLIASSTLLLLVPAANASPASEAFARFDITGNGFLSGTEINACGCSNLDANGDRRITLDEYLAGAGRSASRPATTDDPAAEDADLDIDDDSDAPGADTDAAAAAKPASKLPTPATATTPKATAVTLPNGLYTCNIWMGQSLTSLGKVEIKAGTYRGPANTPSGAYKPLVIDGAGQLSWSPQFSQLAATGATITGSRISGTPAKPAFTVEYLTGRGYRESMDCTRE